MPIKCYLCLPSSLSKASKLADFDNALLGNLPLLFAVARRMRPVLDSAITEGRRKLVKQMIVLTCESKQSNMISLIVFWVESKQSEQQGV